MCGKIWIARDYSKCSGCRRCEIACSLLHEGKIWPEASRIRIFMLTPTAEIPHFCTQCEDYPCIASCPVSALSIDEDTGAVIVDRASCIACGKCINGCPGRIPHIHPIENYALICDLCQGDPACVKACQDGNWNVLRLVDRQSNGSYKLYARTPSELTKDILKNLYGELWKELI